MRDYSDILLSNLIIDGNRPNLGYKEGGCPNLRWRVLQWANFPSA